MPFPRKLETSLPGSYGNVELLKSFGKRLKKIFFLYLFLIGT
jgi:hypothetical protein